jgi:hypothetical protein
LHLAGIVAGTPCIASGGQHLKSMRIMPLRTLALVSHSMAGRTKAPLWVRIRAAPPANPLTFLDG